MKILITGVGGFVGSHIAEFYARNKENEIVGIDNLSRNRLLFKCENYSRYNWEYLQQFDNIQLEYRDIREPFLLHSLFKDFDFDVIFHCAAQTAVTTSITTPRQDFYNNACATFDLLEAIRKAEQTPILIYCSTNKVYGDNINLMDVIERDTRYEFKYISSISEIFDIDRCEHTPYGVSKLAADLYVQEWGKLYGLKTGVFRMSCIYGTQQFGVEDQGWVAHFIFSAIQNKAINIYGDGKQVRDILYVSDLIQAFDRFIKSDCGSDVYNIGGGVENTISLLELIEVLQEELDKTIPLQFHDWRSSDQKVYISNINKIREDLNWHPTITPLTGIKKLITFFKEFI